jgi:hypothetical protein
MANPWRHRGCIAPKSIAVPRLRNNPDDRSNRNGGYQKKTDNVRLVVHSSKLLHRGDVEVADVDEVAGYGGGCGH